MEGQSGIPGFDHSMEMGLGPSAFDGLARDGGSGIIEIASEPIVEVTKPVKRRLIHPRRFANGIDRKSVV